MEAKQFLEHLLASYHAYAAPKNCFAWPWTKGYIWT